MDSTFSGLHRIIPVGLVALFLFGAAFLSAQELDLGGLPGVAEEAAASAPVETAPETVDSQPVAAEESAPSDKKTFFAMIRAGGLIGYLIILLSLVSVAFMIEHGLTIRQKVLMPPGLAEDVLKLLSQGQLGAALKRCQDDPSLLAQMLRAGMMEYQFGWAAVEKGTEEATAEQASKLYRKIEYLNVIGNIAPMLGLLGTVVGMIFAFQNLAESDGYSRASDLAEGIYLALITTVEGLLVAIPSLAAYSIFSNRIAFLMAEATYIAEQVLHPIKKSFVNKAKTEAMA